MKIFFLIIFSFQSISWAAHSTPEYRPVQADNQALIKSDSSLKPQGPKNNPALDISATPIHVRTAPRLVSVVPDSFQTGDQADIDKFNKKIQKKNKNKIFVAQPFGNRTNSYWLNPNFQFGPGSVNDFGSDPNAEQMLQPFIF